MTKVLVEIVGWLAALLILVAYALLSEWIRPVAKAADRQDAPPAAAG